MNEDFIMEIPKAFKKGFCKRLIKKFEDNPAQHSKGVIGNAKENGQKVVAPKVKDDTEIPVSYTQLTLPTSDLV